MTKETLLRRKKYANLEHAIARRKGLTKKQWYSFETEGITLKGGSGPDQSALAISLLLPGGRNPEDTVVEIAIKPGDFPAMVALMASTDRDAALRAMAEEMRFQLCSESK